jgi:hypothetical protein
VGSTEVLPLTVTNVGLPGTVTIETGITVANRGIPTSIYTILTTAQNTCPSPKLRAGPRWTAIDSLQ